LRGNNQLGSIKWFLEDERHVVATSFRIIEEFVINPRSLGASELLGDREKEREDHSFDQLLLALSIELERFQDILRDVFFTDKLLSQCSP